MENKAIFREMFVKDMSLCVITHNAEERDFLIAVRDLIRNGGRIWLRHNESECLKKEQEYTKGGVEVDKICQT